MGLVVEREALAAAIERDRQSGRRIVFTNGCFDLIHPGHVRTLRAAKQLGDVLVVGVNADASVRRLNKGPERPILGEAERAEVVAALEMVDYVCVFPEDTPLELVRRLRPDVIAKGGDWTPETIVGGDIVEAIGGRVVATPFHEGLSTSEIVRRIRERS